MKRKDRETDQRERGVFTVVVALLLPVVLGMFGLGLDISHYVWVGNQLQNAADAAAFAGVKELNGTSGGRTKARTVTALYAQQNTADGRHIDASEIIENTVGRWDFSTKQFVSAGVSDAAANAVRVSVWRQDVPAIFARVLSDATPSQTLRGTAVAVAGGAGAAECTSPFVIASCALQHDAGGNLICPSSLSFQNGLSSTGLTNPDGSAPVNGKSAAPAIKNVMTDPSSCSYPTRVGDELHTQNGNDLANSSVNDINAATNDGADPVTVVMAILDIDCGGGGPSYNGANAITGYVKMNVIGARHTGSAPAAVAAACPGLGKKNVCVTGNCSMIAGAPGGGTTGVAGAETYLVD
jgi:Flp pilus assembly protein TadG